MLHMCLLHLNIGSNFLYCFLFMHYTCTMFVHDNLKFTNYQFLFFFAVDSFLFHGALYIPFVIFCYLQSFQSALFSFFRRIIHEYNDSLNRARRLCRACDLHLAGKPFPPGEISLDDVITYLNWLVHHLHTTQTGVAFMTVSENKRESI